MGVYRLPRLRTARPLWGDINIPPRSHATVQDGAYVPEGGPESSILLSATRSNIYPHRHPISALLLACPKAKPRLTKDHRHGEVAEWSIAPVSKTGVGSRPPWVRIPPSPPNSLTETAYGPDLGLFLFWFQRGLALAAALQRLTKCSKSVSERHLSLTARPTTQKSRLKKRIIVSVLCFLAKVVFERAVDTAICCEHVGLSKGGRCGRKVEV